MTTMWTLPADHVLEIVERSDFFTLIRCAAVCKHLGCDILNTPFIRRVTQQAAPNILAYSTSGTYGKQLLTLVDPATHIATSSCHNDL